jgi:curved DNA-binding protein CbpA
LSNYYAILGVEPSATHDEIRSAYARIAREQHPDRFPDPEEKEKASIAFTEATSAFNTLSNDRARALYDEGLDRAEEGGAPADLARLAYGEGLVKFEHRDFHEAVEHFRLAVAQDPQQSRYHVALARALAKNPRWIRRSVEAYDVALKLRPDDTLATAELADLLERQGLHLRAERLREIVRKRLPGGNNPGTRRTTGGGSSGSTAAPKGLGGLFGRFKGKK